MVHFLKILKKCNNVSLVLKNGLHKMKQNLNLKTSDLLARINMYRVVRMGDLERRQHHEMSVEQTTMEHTVRDEGSSDTQKISGQARDDPRPRQSTAELDWRVELWDHSLQYNSLTELGGPTGQRG